MHGDDEEEPLALDTAAGTCHRPAPGWLAAGGHLNGELNTWHSCCHFFGESAISPCIGLSSPLATICKLEEILLDDSVLNAMLLSNGIL